MTPTKNLPAMTGEVMTGGKAGGDYRAIVTTFSPFCQFPDVPAMIQTAQRLAFEHDQAAAAAAQDLAFHTGAAAKQRAILRELRELAGRRR